MNPRWSEVEDCWFFIVDPAAVLMRLHVLKAGYLVECLGTRQTFRCDSLFLAKSKAKEILLLLLETLLKQLVDKEIV